MISGDHNFHFSAVQLRRALYWLVAFHILVIAGSNYLVQLPLTLLGFHATWGALTFPFIFLVTDLTVRIFGVRPARRIVFCAMWPALVISYVITVLFRDGNWTGWVALTQFNLFVARIAMASFLAYCLGQLMDIFVFSRLRRNLVWWVAPAAAAVAGNAIDTAAFFTTAFYGTDDAYLSQHLLEIACVDYAFKLMVCLLFFLPAYGVLLNGLTRLLLRRQSLPSDHNHSSSAASS